MRQYKQLHPRVVSTDVIKRIKRENNKIRLLIEEGKEHEIEILRILFPPCRLQVHLKFFIFVQKHRKLKSTSFFIYFSFVKNRYIVNQKLSRNRDIQMSFIINA